MTITLSATIAVAGLVRAQRSDGYADQVAAMCASVEGELRGSVGGYFDAVVLTSQARATRLAELRPDTDHIALHAALVEAEGNLLAAAQQGQQELTSAGASFAVRQFPAIRAAELEQNKRYETLGIHGCAD